MANSDPRHAYRAGNPHPSKDPGTESGVPARASTIHPRELAFYDHHLETLGRVNQGISAIARVLIHAQVYEEMRGKLDWMNGNVRHGLHHAIGALTEHADGSIEFMQERAAQYRPDQRGEGAK